MEEKMVARTDAMKRAEQTVEALNQSKDKYVVYKESRPITDLKQMLQTSAEMYAQNTAFMQRFEKNQPYQSITYREALEDVNGLGTALMMHGLSGKRIAVIGENCYQWATSYLAAVCGTGVVVPLDKELGAADLKQLIIEAEVSAVLFTKKFEDMFYMMKESGDTSLEMLVNLNAEEEEGGIFSWKQLKEEGKAMVKKGVRVFLDAKIDPDVMSVLLFTSGTTGIAKGVMLSQRNICEDLMSAPTLLKVYTSDIFFSVLPLHHTYECTCGFLMPLYKGAAIAYCEGLKYIVKNLQEVRPTMLLGVPLIIESLYKNIMKSIRKSGKEKLVKKVMAANRLTSKVGLDLNRKLLKDIYAVFGGRMRVLISGGAAIDPAILQFFNDLGFIAVQGYGLTECAPMAALNPDRRKEMRNSSAGHLLPGMEVKILDPDEEGNGEICLKGPNVMLGYYHMEDETAKVLQDGWFHTGDLGHVDEENFIYITGRKKNVIIASNGKNVFPEELEYLLSKIPYVAESMVWSNAEAGSSNDTFIAATIKPDMEEVESALGKEKAADPAEVEKLLWKEVDRLNETLPLYKKIKKVNVRREDFEKTTGKKIKRFVESNKEK
ncbi:MAG: AMP-binding protein [Firmicutes bacterium]|nr:AMP-binding protein [Bacillota bacterium]MDD7602035.1 AMP-binding protein [Bacillota bacterium]MDY5856028.1 AMP-binding protein [Anaerovoracaceae bacterium]